jgi:cation diffusion facilitator CzcD-associated flavoprotein CzcO
MPGLALLPTINHQSGYAPPTSYSDIAVLIVGSGQSALETACTLSPLVRKIWISARRIEGPESRQAWRRLQRFVLPSNAEVVQLVEAFEGDGTVRLRDGRLLYGIAEVVFATGSVTFERRSIRAHADAPDINTPTPSYRNTTATHLHHIHQPSLCLYRPSSQTAK